MKRYKALIAMCMAVFTFSLSSAPTISADNSVTIVAPTYNAGTVVGNGVQFLSATGQYNVTINYKTELATISKSDGMYFTTDKNMSKWYQIDSDCLGTLDISGYLSSKDIVMYFKDRSGDICEVELQGQEKISGKYLLEETAANSGLYKGVIKIYDSSKKEIITDNATNTIIQYRKGDYGEWNTWISNAVNPPLSVYETKGVTLQFRIAPTESKRGSSVIKVKVPKRSNGPSSKVDYSKLLLKSVKQGVRYRINKSGSLGSWINITDKNIKTLSLHQLAGVTSESAIGAMQIELQTAATEKKVASNITLVDVPEQKTFDVMTAGVTINVSGNAISISDAGNKYTGDDFKDSPNVKKQYEVTAVKSGVLLNYEKAKWTTISNTKAVKVKKAADSSGKQVDIAVGDTLYLRVKSYSITKKTASGGKQKITYLPSTYKTYTVDSLQLS